MSPILAFERVTYTYPGSSAPALADVSLELEPGQLCLLAGLSGQGKSTLLRAACGLVPHFHGGTFAGAVSVAGLDTRTHPPARLGALVGALFQDPETQLVTSSVRAELALSLESRGLSPAATARGVEEVALALGIDALLDRSVHELSGGEQQRVALGAALAGRPPVVLLDEPTSQLDPVAGDELIGLLRRLNQEWETTVLLAEHRLERCLPAADRVIAVHAGRIVHDGSPGSFQAWAEHGQPALRTPAAQLFALAGLRPLPIGVRQARAALRARGLLPAGGDAVGQPGPAARLDASGRPPEGGSRSFRGRSLRSERVGGAGGGLGRSGGRSRRSAPALRMRGVWHELRDGPAILRGLDLELAPGESVALMGRNGAGKSTLLRHAAGLLDPTRGRVERGGRVALLLQNPGDYFLHERADREVSADVLRAAGLAHLGDRHPRDLSGGERQRLALAIVAGGAEPPAVLALDEPTRGMDRAAKAELARELARRSRSGQAVIVATHDPEFAAACALRAVLLADGRVIADGSAAELLAGGWYFATETARVLGGAGGALLPEQGAALLRAGVEEELCVVGRPGVGRELGLGREPGVLGGLEVSEGREVVDGQAVVGGQEIGGGREAVGGQEIGGGREVVGGQEIGGGREAVGGQEIGGGREVVGGQEIGGGREAVGGQEIGGGREVVGGQEIGGGREVVGGQEIGGGREVVGGQEIGGGREVVGGQEIGGGREAGQEQEVAS